MKITLLSILFVCFVNLIAAQQIFLQSLNGEPEKLELYSTSKGTAVIFLLPDCPACKTYAMTLNKLAAQYKSQGISFYGIFPGTYYTFDEMKKYKTDFEINFKLLADTGKFMVKNLGATIAPSVFLLNANGNVMYSGRIDDWFFKPGRKRTLISQSNFANALSSFVGGKEIEIKKTSAIGCFID